MAQQKSKSDNAPSQNIAWNIIHSYFRDNPYNLVSHHLDSYNAFIETGIHRVFRENNPIRFIEKKIKGIKNRKQCFLYMGGKNADKIYFENPILPSKAKNTEDGIVEDEPENFFYPNHARLNNLTYGVTVFYDVDIEYLYYDDESDEEITTPTTTIHRIKLGVIPIMLHSNICILRNMPREARYNMGECRNDTGGYFIINGKEKVVVCQEKFADNMIYTKKHPNNQQHIEYSYSCEIRSVSEDSSKPIRYTSVRISRFNPIKKNSKEDSDSDSDSEGLNSESYGHDLIGKIMVDVPNIQRPVPLFILMRALGILSDKEIIKMCVWDLETNADMVDALLPSITDNNHIYTQTIALEYLTTFTKYKTSKSYLMNVLMNFFLPHIGEDNYYTKARFIGYMVNRILRVSLGKDRATDRDNYTFKRVETSGTMLYDVFREYYLLQKTNIGTQVNKIYNGNLTTYGNNAGFTKMIDNNIPDIFKEQIVHNGLKKAFMGNWGASPKTIRVGVIQDLLILSWFSKISHIRKINLSGNTCAKLVAPHLLHNSQWGIIDPVDTPDGGNIGFHKHMAISAAISSHSSPKLLIDWLIKDPIIEFISFEQSSDSQIAKLTKLFVNGNWIGMIPDPIKSLKWTRLCRRNGLLPSKCSISFNLSSNTLYYYTDGGRLTRPIFYCLNGKPSYENLYNETIDKNTISGKISEMKWDSLITGFGEKNIHDLNSVHNIEDLYTSLKDESLVNITKFLKDKAGIIEYIDTAEEEGSLISMNSDQLTLTSGQNKEKELSELKNYTHLEIDPSLIFGVLGNSVIFPEHNQFPRNLFSCGQSKQASSVYNSNFTRRFDTSVVVLNNGQTPLIKSRYLKYMNNEEHPYGVNTIVAIMSLSGYNVEDAILANAGSVQRGLFRTTYLKTYVVRESSDTVGDSTVNSIISNVEHRGEPDKLKPNYDYSQLDDNGLVREGTALHEKLILAGKATSSSEDPDNWTDSSVGAKKGQSGYVDKVYVTSAPDGFRNGKIRIRDERTPAIGDKMASRAGQKGTLGIIIPEENMPFTADGIRPDLIINPHAIPSRMTIGQLIECLFGKVCAEYGTYGDCTAFASKGSGYDVYSKTLPKMGFHGSGTQVLYDGINGTQLDANIFIGPTYYMRLKHMVADKINYRAKGPLNSLTRQSVHGRANDGGLRIGEMERDSVIAHGASQFLNDSFLTRGDEYFLAVCNHTGSIAVYNPKKDIYLSPFIDGPLTFNISDEGITKSSIDMKSKYGRSFSIVRVPYAFKLLIHELQAMNVQMRIITDDNIDQMMNLSYQSNNIDKLLQLSDSPDLKNTLKEYAEETLKKTKTKTKQPVSSFIEKHNKEMPNKLISKRAFLFGDLSKDLVENIQMDDVAGFSVTDANAANKMTGFLLDHVDVKDDANLTILDGMACVGGNTRSFAADPAGISVFKKGFANVIANELDPGRKEMLVHNIGTVYKRKNVEYHSQNIRILVKELAGKYDVLFLDPEWGGTGYKKITNMRLTIDETPIEYVITQAFSISPRLQTTGVKLPLNYDYDFFVETMNDAELDVTMYAKDHFKNMSLGIVTRKKTPDFSGGNSTINRTAFLPVFIPRKSDPKIFEDSELNDMFSHLSTENQASIIQPNLNPSDREALMRRLYANIEDGRSPIPPTPIYTSEFIKSDDSNTNPKLDILNIEQSPPEKDDISSSSSNTNSSSSDSVKKMIITST